MPHVMISSKKCTGCHMCEIACSGWHEQLFRPSLARLSIQVNVTSGTTKGRTCLQTGCAKCQEVCPHAAIVAKTVTVNAGDEPSGKAPKDTVTGLVLVVDESKCTNCGDCYDVCPTSAIREHPERQVAFKCDLCDGDPQCIAFCQNPYARAVSLKLDKADRALIVQV